MATFEDIKKANETIATTNIKGKEYAEVNQRIKAFRMVYPTGSIITDIVELENGICTIKATVKDGDNILGTGYAQEKEASSYINKTSYIENCETSAVGRALGMCGFGIDTSVCSAEELMNALNNQEPTKKEKVSEYITEKQIAQLMNFYRNNQEKLKKFLDKCGVDNIVQLKRLDAQAQIDRIEAAEKMKEAKANGQAGDA